MKRVLQILGALVLVVILAAGGAFAYGSMQAKARLARTWPEVQGKEVVVPWPLTEAEVTALREAKQAELAAAATEKDAGKATIKPGSTTVYATPEGLDGLDLEAVAMERAIERGKYLATVRLGCVECHGKDLAGHLVADAQPVWTWYAPNITSGGLMKGLKTSDWDRAVRHGVLPDGRSSTMPAIDYTSLSDQELSDLIAYARSLPPSDAVQPATVLGPVGKMLFGFGVIPISAEGIDHTKVRREIPPEVGVTVEYGAHIASTCAGCHREGYNGGKIAQGPPDWPPAKNLTPAGSLGKWTEDEFIQTLRTSVRPDGTALLPPMANSSIGKMSDTELKAIYAFLKSLPPTPDGK